MKSSSLFASFAIAILAAGLPAAHLARADAPAPAPAPDDPRARFSGVFHYSGGPQERAALDAAIERAASEFVFIIRPIVRGKLRDANTIAKQVTFQWSPGSMRVLFTDPPRDYRATDDGKPVHDPASHDPSTRISHRFENGTFIEYFTADDGAQKNLFTLTPDGQGLTMAATVTSPKLKLPVQYSLTYHR